MSAIVNPALIVINGKHIDVETIFDQHIMGKSMVLEFYSGYKEVYAFGSTEELKRNLQKIERARKAVDYGVNYSG